MGGYTSGTFRDVAAGWAGDVETGETSPMGHVLRPASEKTFNIADALAKIPRCVLMVDSAANDVVADLRDDDVRAKARDLVRSLSAGCPECGFRESHGVLRNLYSLLAVAPGGSARLQRSYADRLLELVALLKAGATK